MKYICILFGILVAIGLTFAITTTISEYNKGLTYTKNADGIKYKIIQIEGNTYLYTRTGQLVPFVPLDKQE